MGDIFSAIVLLFVITSLALWVRRLARNSVHRADYVGTVRAIRWWMVPGAIAQLTLVGTTFWALTTFVPFTRFGWWIALGGSGNVALGQTGKDGIGWMLLAVAIPLGVTLLIPLFAVNEERMFRAGAEGWTAGRRIRKQVTFGLIHLTMGIPVAAGLALVISGFYFEWVYLRSVRRHRSEIDALRDVPPPAEEACPPLPVGAPYDPEEWDRIQMLRSEVRARNRQRRLDWEVSVLKESRRPRGQQAALQASAVTTAAAAHATSNWIICGVLLVAVVSELFGL
ncbi:hypothetical protein [Rhodococcus sp. NPDC049939]|uniref:hypothetical protein n=1 Tax=Rhodococcus sp. NPDC049939 TaxID=3155511 RepID=UPI00340EFCF4